MATAPTVIDVGDETFEHEVVERSHRVPVVVDCWAPWCAPCRALGPVLERLATEYDGAFILAKVNVDEAPMVKQALRVQGIPAVKGFRDGALVAEFVGAQPESAVRRFLETLLPSEADGLAREGLALSARDGAAARAKFEQALALYPRHPEALLGLARLHAAEGREADALPLLQRIPPGAAVEREAERFAAELRTRADGTGDEGALRGRVAADPNDLEARLQLGRLLAARGSHEDALETLLEVVRHDPGFQDGAARKAMLDLFEVVGARAPLSEKYRSALAQTLFR
jgi:putative thioredoxin